ncbi:MAG TPA: HPr family phosphocarrier protein [Roseiflexaceae bacterium]|nr:HPr family phosphocarrier protein [Roseiflexaceae bacterium]HMP38784.1 HPr family phosphocarrier protein [Roseiflexaceae bacterium]
MTETTLTITHPHGLHARPAADLYRKTREFRSAITFRNLSRPESPEVTASVFNLLQLGIVCGHRIRIRAEGEDEREAISALDLLARHELCKG